MRAHPGRADPRCGGVSSPFSPSTSDLHRRGTAGCGGSCRQLGHLCHRPRLHPASNPELHRGGREGDRAWILMDEETAQLHRRQGHLAQPAAPARSHAPRLPGGHGAAGRVPMRSFPAFRAPTNWPRSRNIKTAWGTDVLFSQALARSRAQSWPQLIRWYTPAEALIMATSTNAELLTLLGPAQPLSGQARCGGARRLCRTAARRWRSARGSSTGRQSRTNFVVIMKDGQIGKNSLEPSRARSGRRGQAQPSGAPPWHGSSASRELVATWR